MICHVVPKTYLKSWKPNTGNASDIYVFDKTSDAFCSKNVNNLVGTNFAEKSEYILDMYKCAEHEAFYNVFENIFNEVSLRYSLKYNNIDVTTVKDFMHVIKYLGDTTKIQVINKSDNSQYKVKKTKAYIEQIWRKDVSTIIEDFFSNCYENKWDGFRIYIEQESAKNATINISCYYDYLIEFLAVQKLRVKNNTDGVNSAIMSVLSSLLKRGNKTVTLSPDILLFSNLYGYAEYKKSSDKKYEDNLVSIHINQIKTNKIKLFLLKSIGTEFITTDNPYVIVNERKQKYSSEYEGLFFPISPNLCLFGSPCESISCSDMPVIAVDSVVASYVNHILKTEASKNYVSRQSDSKPQFSKTIPVGLLNRNFKDSGFH